MNKDEYFTISKQARCEIKEKGSRFIGQALYVSNRQKAEKAIETFSKQFHDATHNCYAFQTGIGSDTIYLYNDDGEPSSTAGKPIYQAIVGRDLTNVLIIVTRYFGGTKLGTGGLIRAYGGCAGQVLDQAGIIKKFIFSQLNISFEYDQTSIIMHQISISGAEIIKRNYDESCHFIVKIRQGIVAQFINETKNATAGKAKVNLINQ